MAQLEISWKSAFKIALAQLAVMAAVWIILIIIFAAVGMLFPSAIPIAD